MNIFKGAKYAIAAVLMAASSMAAHATVITYSTAQSEFDAGVLNQGWWGVNYNANSDGNDNHYTGDAGSGTLRSFYTFDLSQLSGTVTTATLRVQRGGQSGNVNLKLWDVSTTASLVNNNNGSNSAIYNDLGSGNQYGVYSVSNGLTGAYLTFDLNAQALLDINAAHGFFTIGASVNPNQYIFSSTGGDTTYLDLTVVPSAVPEPTSVALLGLGLLGVVAARRKSAKSKNA